MLIIYVFILGVTELVFVDECGLNSYYQRVYARAARGVRVHGIRPGQKFKRTNIVAGLWGGRHVAVQCYGHSTKSWFFEDWFEFELLAVLPKGVLVIMDNAAFHRKKQLFKIAARHGAYVLFLPPYSPDFNPIEKSWANFKRWLCDNFRRFPNFDWAVECYFETMHC
jgi:hypothetical protein